MSRTFYFDTNAFTQLLERSAPSSYDAIRHRVLAAGAEVILSPVNIFEILQTRDHLQRERLIYLAQCLCSGRLLVEVETIMVHFVAERSLRQDLKQFVLSDGYHHGPLAHAWQTTHADRRRTLLFDRKDFQRFDVVRRVFSLVHAHLRRGGSPLTAFDLLESESASSSDIYEALGHAALRRREVPAPPASEISVSLDECIMFVMTLLFCSEVTLFPERIREFWNVIGIGSVKDRIEYCATHFAFALRGGPMLGISAVLAAQATKRYDSGNTFDCFHMAYSPHVDVIYTHDSAMVEIAKSFTRSAHFARITPYEEFHRVFVVGK